MAERISGVVLAGGESRRMGGDDKGLLKLVGRNMIAHVIERFAPQVSSLAINANRNAQTYLSAYPYPNFADSVEGFAGPLAGMAAGLAQADTDLVAFVPCDAPLLPLDLVTRLHSQLHANDADIAVAHDGEYRQPVFILIKRSLEGSLNDFLAGGDHKIILWFKQHKHVLVDFSDQVQAFENVNTPEGLRRVEAILNPVPNPAGAGSVEKSV